MQPVESVAVADARPPVGRSSYREILVSTLLIGGSTGVNAVVSLLRTKAFALLLGPSGVGLLGVLTSLADVARSAAELGINSSGVKQIAAAAATGDARRVALTARVLRRAALGLGLLGATGLVLLAEPLARLTFGDASRAPLVAGLSLVVALRLLADGQSALLQGLRRVGALARLNVLGPLLGTLLAVPLVWRWGLDAVLPALVAVGAGGLAMSWWYSRREAIEPVEATVSQRLQVLRGLLGLGSAFMASALLMAASAYLVRLLVLRDGGESDAGLYQAAWGISGLVVGFVLQAMGADFYPRLVGAIDRHEDCNRLVNEQTRVGLLLALPGVVGTLVLAPLALWLLYSPAFSGAVELLRWMCLGMALRILTWPVGYIVVAAHRPVLFASLEAAWTVVNVGLVALCLPRWGLEGAGMAFLGAYAVHALLLLPVVRRLTGFRWTPANRRGAAGFVVVVAAVFVAQQALAPLPATLFGLAVLAAATAQSVRAVLTLLPAHQLPARLRRFRPREEAAP